ncbi:hypothetical protein AGRA3207_000889 [Actinomadura graeca]|uniref:Uncharacterized protein n=1 Tax=Actinomadura graeca TaxID=2750812 RepID=A0ABX8QP88_9ACTN|nr:hypothetical protein [Actinomadura graeca]QXJ20216.1 hypothetical protein AGRA3207_000889 [Actinomadura graeca]
MPPKAKPAEPVATRPVSITAVVDPVAALAAGNIQNSLYLYDTNKAEGSTGFGTGELRTRVRSGDRLLWNVVVLECETYAAIDGIEIDERVCEPVRKVYPGTDIVYWTGTVKRAVTEPVPYRLRFRLGTVTEPFTTAESALVGHGAPARATVAKERA